MMMNKTASRKTYLYIKLSMMVLILATIFSGCGKQLDYEPGSLDDPAVLDPAVLDPTFRVSQRPNVNVDVPVIIVAHGYTGGSAEWEEFLDFVGGKETGMNPEKGVYV